MPSSHLLFSSSPTPVHQLHHPFRHVEPHLSPLFRLSAYRRNQTSCANQGDHDSNPNLLGTERFLEADDQEEAGEKSQESCQHEDEHHSDPMDEQDRQASGQEDDDEDDLEYDQDEDGPAEQVMIGTYSPTLDVSFESSMSVGTAPPTPSRSPNPQGTDCTDNVHLARVSAHNSFLPAHLFAPNPNAMPPSSSPHRMDISPRSNIPSYSHQSCSFQPHSPDDPFRGPPPRSQPQTPSKVSPTTSEPRRTIGLAKAQLRPNLSSGSLFRRPSTTMEGKFSPGNLARTSDGMDIDSPGYAHPHHRNIHASPMGSDDDHLNGQHPSPSTSQGSTGKRSRSNEDEEHEQACSPSSCSGHHDCNFTSGPRVSKPSRLSPDGPSHAEYLFGANTRLCAEPSHSFSPFQVSSPSDAPSPSVKAAAKMNVGHKAGARSLSGFRFPASKSHVPSTTNLPATRPQPYGLGSVASTSGNGAAPRRPTLGVVQSSATLFSRHQSKLSTSSSTSMNRQRDVFGKPASKSRRAISFAAAEGDSPNFMLQGDRMVADPEEEDEESGPDDSLVFNCSPVARVSHNVSHSSLVSNTWHKSTESPLRPNRSASHNHYRLNLAGKSSGTADSGSLAPPTFNFAMAAHSPTRKFVASLGSTIESPAGMAFSEKERAGKILPCHKVSNDGLMRISPGTMDRLLEGLYDENISQKIVIDCRFGYEYEGGHIHTAINVPDKEVVPGILLQGEIFPNGEKDVPPPSESGKMDSAGQTKKVVVVFHCEFSAMRAPTVAKYLREQDRHMNMAQYPALHYPEVYILEGGYARYHAHSPQHCQGSYVGMDDPNYRSDRHADLNQFRTRENAAASRAKSFTYGEKSMKSSAHQKEPGFLLHQAHSESQKPRLMFQ